MFKRVDRYYTSDLIVIPGWGFNWCIFEHVDLPFNYLFYTGKSISKCAEAVNGLMSQAGAKKYSILGWSQGGFAASYIAGGYADRIDSLILMSVRQSYNKSDLYDIIELLKKNTRAYMMGFYRSCFAGHDPAVFRWFRKTLMRQYLTDISGNELIDNLYWLAQAEICAEDIMRIKKVTIVHGIRDEVVAVEYARKLAGICTDAQLVLLDKCGHLPFLESDFKKQL